MRAKTIREHTRCDEITRARISELPWISACARTGDQGVVLKKKRPSPSFDHMEKKEKQQHATFTLNLPLKPIVKPGNSFGLFYFTGFLARLFIILLLELGDVISLVSTHIFSD